VILVPKGKKIRIRQPITYIYPKNKMKRNTLTMLIFWIIL